MGNTLQTLEPEQAKLFLMEMLDKQETEDVVILMATMDERKRAGIIEAFQTPDEIAKIAEVLRLIRQGQPESGNCRRGFSKGRPPEPGHEVGRHGMARVSSETSLAHMSVDVTIAHGQQGVVDPTLIGVFDETLRMARRSEQRPPGGALSAPRKTRVSQVTSLRRMRSGSGNLRSEMMCKTIP